MSDKQDASISNSDIANLESIRDSPAPILDTPDDRTAGELKRRERDERKLTPSELHQKTCQAHIDSVEKEKLRAIQERDDLKTALQQEITTLRLEKESAQTTLASLQVRYAVLKESYTNAANSGLSSYLKVALGSVGVSVGSYFIPTTVGYVILGISLFTCVLGCIEQGMALSTQRKSNKPE